MNNEMAKKRINPYYFTDRELQVGFNISLYSYNKQSYQSF